MAKRKKRSWFKKVRGSYLPNNDIGALSYIPYISYLAYSAIIAWRNTDKLSLAIIIIVPNWIVATVIMTWFAARHSR